MSNNQLSIINRKGAALLVVLFIVMAITILSLGFLSRSDVELACGENMILRTQMDYLAESALEHAKGLILNPQDVAGEYWTGDTGQQLVAGGSDYYDVSVNRHGPSSGLTYRCNYDVNSTAYRLKGGEEVGRSSLTAELRLDPCIAYWAGISTTISSQVTVNGDVYCDGNLINKGTIRGDVFASGTITNSVMSGGQITGSSNENVISAPVNWPGLAVNDFSSQYYIGSTQYSVVIVDSNIHPGGQFNSSPNNPAGVRYYNGNLELQGGVNIKGMLVVNGTLTISGANNVISAVKNFPALLVNGEVVVGNGAALNVNGLAQIGQRMVISAGAANVNIDIVGGLFIASGGIDGVGSNMVVDIKAAPARASLETWPTADNPARWTPVGGAFFKSIERE